MLACGNNCGCSGGFGGAPSLQSEITAVQNAGLVVQQPASGNILDAFGAQYRNYVLIGGGALAVLLLVKAIK